MFRQHLLRPDPRHIPPIIFEPLDGGGDDDLGRFPLHYWPVTWNIAYGQWRQSVVLLKWVFFSQTLGWWTLSWALPGSPVRW